MTRALIEAVAPLVVGADPLDHDLVRRRLYAETGMAHLGTQGISWALSGIDTALWDLAGRIARAAAAPAVGRGLADALRRSTPTSCPTSRRRWRRTPAHASVERASGRCTSRSGSRPRSTRRACAPCARRSATGRGIRIDANGAWSPGLAMRLLDRLAALRPRVRRAADPARRPGRAGAPARARAGADPGARVEPLASRARWPSSATARPTRCSSTRASTPASPGARTAAQIAEVAGLPALTHTFGELGVGTALMLQLHAAHRNLVLDNQTYYPNLTDDVIAGGPLQFDGLLPRRPDRPRASASSSTPSASRTTPRTTRARWRAGRRRRPDDPLLRPRLPDPAAGLSEERVGGRLEGKVAVVTGAGSGMGRAGSVAFAREGAAVVLAEIDAERGERVAAAIRGRRRPRAGRADRRDVGARRSRRWCERAVDEFGSVDVLYHCAVDVHFVNHRGHAA